MENKTDSTEEKILGAAKAVFINKGMDGARMQEIADKAGINKTLLPYLFRSNTKPLATIFSEIIQFAFPKLTKIIRSDADVITKIEQFIDSYIEVLRKHPFIPGFVMKELSRDPSGLLKLAVKFGVNPEPVFASIQAAMDRGEIVAMKPQHLAANVISMCVFPFAARPIVSFIIFKDDKQALETFYRERAEDIKKFVIDAVVIRKKEIL